MLRRTLLAAPALIPALAHAQAPWPVRPVRWILPDSPGNGNDITARMLAPHLEAALGQPIVIDNRVGAGGRIGVEAAWRAAPDGYTFLFGNAGSNGINAALYPLAFDLATAFDPVSLIVSGPNVLCVNPRTLPVASVAELLGAIRARPGQLNYASGGVGASNHLGMELLKHLEGLDIVHVPYRSAAEMAQAAVAGEPPVLFANLITLMPFIRTGQLRALAVTTLRRSPTLPEVPTMQEAGVRDFEIAVWNGLLAPAGTPRPVIERMNAALVRLRDNAELRARIAANGGELVVSSPEEFGRRIAADIAKWRAVVAAANIRAE
jgi:tripartite-type tricarboxylate transporter receptor subunit TctC